MGRGGRVGAGERVAVGAAPPTRPPACRTSRPMRQVWLGGVPPRMLNRDYSFRLFVLVFFRTLPSW